MNYGVVVVGAGLAGLSAAIDLLNRGTDVLVVEARNRPGGRVALTTLHDGRIVQLGGEAIGPFHESYLGLAEGARPHHRAFLSPAAWRGHLGARGRAPRRRRLP